MMRYREALLSYSFAILMVALATYTRSLMSNTLQGRVPFATYTLAVIAVAWIGGVKPAILALTVSTVSAAHFIIPPEHSLLIATFVDQVALVVFFIAGTVSIYLFSRVEQQRKQALAQVAENQELNNQLRVLDKQKNEFLSLLAHELRSPLAPIANSIGLIEQSQSLSQNDVRYVQVLSRRFKYLVHLVDDLLDVSRYLRGVIHLREEELDLVELIQNARDMLADECAEKRHIITLDLPSEPIWIRGDNVRLCQIFSNLLSNAIKFTPAEGHIHVKLERDESFVLVRIIDNGIGIPLSIQSQVFTAFFQANPKQSRFASGLGLGLSIVKKLVELHGGEIRVNSEGANSGTEFVVAIPVYRIIDAPQSSLQEENARPRQIQDSFTKPSGTLRRILVVDDDRDTALTLCELLRMEGYEVYTGSSGFDAISLYRQLKPSIILLDIGLPELNGFEVAEKLRQEADGSTLTIVAISGWGAEQDLRKSVQAGFDAHFVKPVRLEELLSLLKASTEIKKSSTQVPTLVHHSA